MDAFLAENKKEIEMVFHLGAVSSTTEIDVDLILENNLRLSIRLWRWCAKNNVPFLFASSAATYGNGENGFDDSLTSDQLAGLKPLNPYGWSKHLFDRWVTSRVESGDSLPPQWVGLKFFNVYGPNEGHKGTQSSLINQLFPKIISGLPSILFKSHRAGIPDGEQRRDFIWVGDCVEVMLWFFAKRNISGIFNVGTGEARTFKDLTLNVYASLKLEPNIEFINTPPSIEKHYQYFTEASLNKLREAGFPRNFTSLEEGVKKYITNFLNTNDPYR
tara:strand:+ start:16 stop:837 length:822 start_codon:yes stop_codon:yes gene_type:complete